MKQTKVMNPETSPAPLQHSLSGNVAPLVQDTRQPKSNVVHQAIPSQYAESLQTHIPLEIAKEMAEVRQY